MKRKHRDNSKNLQDSKLSIQSRSGNRVNKETSPVHSRQDAGVNFNFFYEVKNSSSSFVYCFDKGVNFYYFQKYLLAISMFGKALDIERNNIFALNNIAVCYLKTSNLVEAIKNFHQIIVIDKTQEFAYYNIAAAYLLFNKLHEAVLCIKSAESVITNFSSKFMNLVQVINSINSVYFNSIKNLKNYENVGKLRLEKNSLKLNPPISKSIIFSKKVLDELYDSRASGFSITHLEDDFSLSQDQIIEEENHLLIKLKQNVGKTMSLLEKKKITPVQKLVSKYVTEEELRELLTEFEKIPLDKNYTKIDQILQKLQFFSQFPIETRLMIYGISLIQEFNAGTMIFKQGEIGETLYVIIKGAVSIVKKNPEYGNKKIVVDTIYDGRQFGEIAILNAIDSETAVKERTASCMACEKSALLCIPRDTLSKLILCKNKDELDRKIEFLAKTIFFAGFDEKLLLPLALNLDKITFKLNDSVVKKGQAPSGLHLVMKGFLDVVVEEFNMRNSRNEDFSQAKARAKSPMYFKCDPPERPKTQSKSPIFSTCQSDLSLNARPFSRLSKETLKISSLKELDYFCSRSLKSSGLKPKLEPSKFSVTVQSSTAEILILTRYHMQFLTAEMQDQFRTIIGTCDDPDCPSSVDSKKMKKTFHNWNQYKYQLLDNIHKDSFIERKRKIFPFN